MFRLSLLSLSLVAANASLFGTNFFGTNDLKRQLQDFDLDAFQFNFAGVNINAEIAQELCPDQWQAVVGCVISDCPQFMEVCPELEVPAENMGTVPPAAAPMEGPAMEGDMGDMGDTEMMDGNMTETHNMTPAVPMPEVTPDAGAAAEVPTCEEIEQEFCEAFVAEDVEDCCLLDCAESLQGLVVCLVKETTGEDRSDCTIPECPTPAPDGGGATATDGTPAPAPAPSGASSILSKLSILAASVFAFAML